jgi:hypothetical protein
MSCMMSMLITIIYLLAYNVGRKFVVNLLQLQEIVQLVLFGEALQVE